MSDIYRHQFENLLNRCKSNSTPLDYIKSLQKLSSYVLTKDFMEGNIEVLKNQFSGSMQFQFYIIKNGSLIDKLDIKLNITFDHKHKPLSIASDFKNVEYLVEEHNDLFQKFNYDTIYSIKLQNELDNENIYSIVASNINLFCIFAEVTKILFPNTFQQLKEINEKLREINKLLSKSTNTVNESNESNVDQISSSTEEIKISDNEELKISDDEELKNSDKEEIIYISDEELVQTSNIDDYEKQADKYLEDLLEIGVFAKDPVEINRIKKLCPFKSCSNLDKCYHYKYTLKNYHWYHSDFEDLYSFEVYVKNDGTYEVSGHINNRDIVENCPFDKKHIRCKHFDPSTFMYEEQKF